MTQNPSGSFVPAVQGPPTALQLVHERIAKANDLNEVILLTQIRGEILRQDRAEDTARHRRRIETLRTWASYAFSLLTVALGVVLSVFGFTLIGAFIIGAGLFTFVPRYILAV